MGAGDRALAGLIVMLLIMPTARAEGCRKGEYLHEGHCCLFCPAGTYVAQHCTAPHLRGRCVPCVEGESYTTHENGLEECLPCRQCKEDQITLRPCALTHDAECQCKQGYFCPAGSCEICQKCSTTCPEGKEIVQNCNATTDLECGLLNQGRIDVWISVIVFVIGALLLLLVIRKLKNTKATSTDNKDAEKSLHGALSYMGTGSNAWKGVGRVSPSLHYQQNLGHFIRMPHLKYQEAQEPNCQIIVKDLSQKELRDCFWTFIKEVPQKKWKQLMRTHLQENDIVKITCDFPNDVEEQSYQMLLTWKNTLGEKQSTIKLLDELRRLDTKAYDNVLNALKSSNIISKLKATD
ncbi:tumor necrosis factor receptor superfamily member 10A isoform X2 [Cuculus canorus]|uniref:tumor necrosis factor receptor superfamily member 10A isoform X2 n=1 Tax=Cuculus canorus TaxID=55661 RepID=UPI0023AAC8B5|nr:tumor necrosis factor receptor superfamily member 10A isoform X2 [Cuculus canorus]